MTTPTPTPRSSANSKAKQVAPEIPLNVAWQVGRRIYVRCSKNSQINQQLIGMGASFDWDVKARWVGTSKRDAVVPLILAHLERINEMQAVKDLGLWLELPPEATEVREAAHAARAIFDGVRKAWAFRDVESQERVAEIRDRWVTERDEKVRLEQVAQDAQAAAERAEIEAREKQAAAEAAQRERETLLAGRVPLGEDRFTVVSTRRMNKYEARGLAYTKGLVIRLGDGRRGVVVGVEVWFSNSETASSMCWHPETHDLAHWDFRYSLVIVEPTPEEAAQDAQDAQEKADAAELHSLEADVEQATDRHAVDSWTPIPDDEKVVVITQTSGTVSTIRGAIVTLTRAGEVWWQHPGYYDSYVYTEGRTTDPDLVRRMQAVAAGGSRRRVQPGPSPHDYSVMVQEENGEARG